MKSSLTITALLLLSFSSIMLSAQEISGGFKTGLSFSKFDGELLEDANGNAIESFDYATGFHVGAIVNIKFTDYFGIRTELLYSQKGSDYNFNAPSFVRLYDVNGANSLVFSGERSVILNTTNSHIDIPILVYLRLGKIELAGGVNAGVMVSSTATGELTLRNASTLFGQPVDDFVVAIDANYFKDAYQVNDFSESSVLNIQNTEYLIPSVIGGYFDANDADDNLYKRIDLGLNAQVGFYLNQGLLLSFRLNYGLSDITNQEQDVDPNSLNAPNLTLRDDQDRNISLQTSIGFSF